MNLTYYKSESTVRPQLMEVGMTTVYLHKNIIQETHQDSFDSKQTYKMYVYDEVAIPLEYFNEHSNEILMQAQLDNNNAQLTIMEALADLGVMVAMTNEPQPIPATETNEKTGGLI